jgi:signal transduction histidine kinase
MKICNYNLNCKKYNIDFIEKKEKKLYSLYKKNNTLISYYPVSGSNDYIMEISMKKNNYSILTNKILNKNIYYLILLILIIFLISILFSLYSLKPFKISLELTNEFIKDILHDINTPLSSLRLNISILKDEYGEKKEIIRSENAINNILQLQSHLRAYINNTNLEKEIFNLSDIVFEIVNIFEKKNLTIKTNIDIDEDIFIYANLEIFSRIISNIISNAFKYNKKNGNINILYQNKILIIEDTGIGIKNTNKVFDRFYKEQERGIGIGLHIVKKFSDELKIKINIKSELNKFTKFELELKNIIQSN